jgi:hypothetical protein
MVAISAFVVMAAMASGERRSSSSGISGLSLMMSVSVASGMVLMACGASATAVATSEAVDWVEVMASGAADDESAAIEDGEGVVDAATAS